MKPVTRFQETEDGFTLRLQWDNRQVSTDGCLFWILLIFWIIWAPATVFVTSLFLSDASGRCFFAIWLIFGWMGTLLIPYAFLGRSWIEWIEVSEHAVCHGREGFLAPARPKSFPISTIECIFFGHCGDETVATLSIFHVPNRFGFSSRHLFGYWLARDLKKQLFETIEAFVRGKEIPLQINKGYHILG